MNKSTVKSAAQGSSIAVAERETGLAKGTLRVWEKRYGFPRPLRDASGDRLYPAEQIEQLKLISRLLDAGLRPNKVVGLDDEALRAQIATLTPVPAPNHLVVAPEAQTPSIMGLVDLIGMHDPQALRHALTHAQLSMGLAPFITDIVAPLTSAVGDAWVQGRFEVFEEHLYTEVITGVLRSALSTLSPPGFTGRPKVLLTTMPQELHGLGLLMVEGLMSLDGCACVSLGTQTPIGDIVQAAEAHRADVVALSFTNSQNGSLVLAGLRDLRMRLPAHVALWVGGSCNALYQKPLEGIVVVKPLEGVPPLLAQWRHEHPDSVR